MLLFYLKIALEGAVFCAAFLAVMAFMFFVF
jgi:hypothetical protein